MHRKMARWPLFLAITIFLCGSPALADFGAGQAAWQAGRSAEALAQWQAAARDGDARAMLALGRAYVKGLGVPQDYTEAHKWLNLAAGRGNAEAAEERDALAVKMTAEERAEAQRLARAWRSSGTVDAPKSVAVPQAPASSPPVGSPPARAIREAQGLMAALGYDPGPADGRWGPRTGRAYATFLRDAGLPPAEMLTPDALRALRATAKGRNVAAATESPRPAPASQRQANPPPADLYRLVEGGDIDGLKAALTRGADANSRDAKGWTPLMHAADKGQSLLVLPLLKSGADPDLRLADGATALFIAAVHGHEEILTVLLNGGADPSIKGPQGKTAATVARAKFGGLEAARRNNASQDLLELLEKGIPSLAEIKDDLERAKSGIRSALLECRKFLLNPPRGRYYGQVTDVKFLDSENKVVVEQVLYSEDNKSKTRSKSSSSFNYMMSPPLLKIEHGNHTIYWPNTSFTFTMLEYHNSETGYGEISDGTSTHDGAGITICGRNSSEVLDGFKRLIALRNKFAER